MSKILITGGAGFIGAHTAKRLQAEGHEVVLFDDLNSFLYPASLKEDRLKFLFEGLQQPRFVQGSVLDERAVAELFETEKFDKVLHFAALANPGASVGAEKAYADVNILGTINILKACTEHDVSQLIFAGSSSLYNDEQTPFSEDAYPLVPRSPYGASKAAAEDYLRMWNSLHGLSITVLRFFSVYGPWGRPDMAPFIFAKQVIAGETLAVTRDRKRDFTYIRDIEDGILAAVDKPFDFEVINLGKGQPQNLREFITEIEKAAGKKAVLEDREAPPGEMRITYADISKAKRLLGYEPEVSIEEGVVHLVEWMQEHFSRLHDNNI